MTSPRRTGDVVEAYLRRTLNATDLAAWGDALLDAGFDSDAIIESVSDPNMHWQKVRSLFERMCRELGLSLNIAENALALSQEVMIAEYRHGLRGASELLHRFDDLRKRIGFPEPIDMRLIPDNADGTNDSGYYSSSSRKCGIQLDAWIRTYLDKVVNHD